MKATWIAGIMGAVIAMPAMAADMALKAPPLAPVYSWSGFYVGANLGYGVGNDPTTETTVSGAAYPLLGAGAPLYAGSGQYAIDPSGWNGGFQAGYNLQVSPIWVLGIETDFQFAGMNGSANCILPCGTEIVPNSSIGILTGFPVIFSNYSYSQKLDWFGTVRGRAGYAAGPALFYVTGGLAYGEVERAGSVSGITVNNLFGGGSTFNAFSGSFDNSSTNVGYTVGAGIEAKLWGQWSAKAEYLYIDLGSVSDTFNTMYTSGTPSTGVAATRTVTSDVRENIFRVGLNYQFSAPPPP